MTFPMMRLGSSLTGAVILYTIGHSNQTRAQLIAQLEQYRIDAVADVRSVPYSRRLPQFNKTDLENELLRNGIRYVFLGDELGARRKEESAYTDMQATYERVAKLPAFQSGLNRVVRGLQKGLTLSLLCAERDPLICHRAILVSRHLEAKGVKIMHILGDGSLESHSHLERRMQRVLQKLGVTKGSDSDMQLDLLGQDRVQDRTPSSEERMEEAYRLQGLRIAYTKQLVAA